jgi:flagellar biosynthesis/type III secretory pathway protein FliH
MHDAFVPMREWLAPVSPLQEVEPQAEVPILDEPIDELPCDEIDRALADARRYRAALAEALQLSIAELTQDIASEILARELELKPCDIAGVVERAIERYAQTPVRVRVHAEDAARVPACWQPVIDEELRVGDVILEVRAGTIDARLGTRLERVLCERQSC